MSRSLLILTIAFLHLTSATTEATPTPPTTSLHPIYQPSTLSTYVPHATYLDSELYPETNPTAKYGDGPIGSYSTGLFGYPMETLRGYQKHVLSILIVVGLFVRNVRFLILNGVGLFVIGGIFTTVVCALIPYCPLSFHTESQAETVRSLITPERISKAAAIVHEAAEKYDRLQRSVNN